MTVTAEKLKVPLQGGCGEMYNRKKRTRRIQMLAGLSFLIILNVSLLVFSICTLSRVKKLENEVDWLKNTLSDFRVLQDTFAKTIAAYEDDSWDNAYEGSQEETEPAIYIGKIDDSDYVEDYDSYDQSDLNETEEATTSRDAEFISVLSTSMEEDDNESRKKRSVIAATEDGVPVNSESYAEKRARNRTRTRHRPNMRYATRTSSRPVYYGTTPWVTRHNNSIGPMVTTYSSPYRRQQTKSPTKTPPPVYTRRSRVMHTEDKSKAFRQVVRKSSLKSGDTYNNEGSSDGDFTIIRDENFGRRRYTPLQVVDERHPRAGRIRLLSTHYGGDTSKYVVGQHTNFNGNGHLRHPQRTFVDWRISDWVKSSGMDTHFTMEDGILTIKESGVYFIYAQIYYLDEHDTMGFRVHKNGDSILQCTITVHSTERRLKGNTCYTAGTEYLAEGDTISLADITNGRYSLFEPGKSFFGLVKFGDIKIDRT